MKTIACLLAIVLLVGCQRSTIDLTPRDTRAEGFVSIAGDHFEVDGEQWFPMMVNYKVDWHQDSLGVSITPAAYYEPVVGWGNAYDDYYQQLGAHLACMEDSLHANAVRFCMDGVNSDEKGYFYGTKENPIYLIQDSSRIFSAIGRLVETIRNYTEGIRAMILLKAPLDEELSTFTQSLLAHFAQEPLIWAYDFMNEPLYFDPAPTRDKMDAYRIVDGWRAMMNEYAPHQLFTVATAEPIEVFEWDPTILPVDFVEMHTYHPLRVASEMYWYGRFCTKPWMVGETSLPDDLDTLEIPVLWQSIFMQESFRCAVENGACGYGWWEFQDCPNGVNAEARYAGLFACPAGGPGFVFPKPAVRTFRSLDYRRYAVSHPCPMNYQNMLGYCNLAISGKVVEKGTRRPIEGALIRGWNEDWSVGMNTYSDADGNFTLHSNDYCVHFEVSAPGMSHLKFDRRNLHYTPQIDDKQLKNRNLEYQQIDYRPFLVDEQSLLTFQPSLFDKALSGSDMGTLTLKQL